jgi:hypothetical protein
MSVKKTREQKETELHQILKREAPNRAKFVKKCQDLDIQNADTISMLQRRVMAKRFEPLMLPGGDVVHIRVTLSREEEDHLGDLRKEFVKIKKLTPEEEERQDALNAELATMTMKTPGEIRRVREITRELEAMSTLSEEKQARLREIDYDIVATVTQDPNLTKEWLLANPDAFSQDDLFWIIAGFRAQEAKAATQRQEMIAQARLFRGNTDGAKLR